MRFRELLTESTEIEFVCANPDYCDATSPKRQRSLFKALKSVPGVVVYKQDFGAGEVSMAVILKSSANKHTVNQINQIASDNGVAIDLTSAVSDMFVDSIYTGDLENLADWYDSDEI